MACLTRLNLTTAPRLLHLRSPRLLSSHSPISSSFSSCVKKFHHGGGGATAQVARSSYHAVFLPTITTTTTRYYLSRRRVDLCSRWRRWNSGSGGGGGGGGSKNGAASSGSSSSSSSGSSNNNTSTFLSRFLATKPMPPRNTPRWYAEMALLCTVFGITGSSTMFLVRPAVGDVLGLQGSMKDGPMSYRIASVVIMTPMYATLLVIVGTVFGRHAYFRHFSVKMFSRFGIPPELMDKNFKANAKNFRKW